MFERDPDEAYGALAFHIYTAAICFIREAENGSMDEDIDWRGEIEQSCIAYLD